jgi:UPF0042 nucleotide-binding protein
MASSSWSNRAAPAERSASGVVAATDAPAAIGEPGPVRLIIITGLSGAGKSHAIRVFEDMGYYCVDNLPATLIPTFVELCAHSTRRIRRIALGVDVRAGEYLAAIAEVLAELRKRGHAAEVLFLEASEETLVRRYHETRRRHPLSATLLEGIRGEREVLAQLRELAERVIDTSHITVHQLKQMLVELYGEQEARLGLHLTLVSFGYKFGIPYDADLVFDCRFLPNPFFVDGLKRKDGRAPDVRRFVFERAEGRELLERLSELLGYLLPRYQREGKSHLTIAVGCTGGRHRSVALVEELREFVEGQGLPTAVVHRDVDRDE